MDTLDRYLVKEFLLYFSVILMSLAFIYLGIDFLTKFWDIKMPLQQVAELYGYRLPAALQQFLPVACLMSVLLVLTSMSRQNELLALSAGGIGTLRLVSTFIAVVATLSTVGFLIFDPVVPAFAKRQVILTQGADAANAQNMTFYKNGFWYRTGNLIYNVGRLVPGTNTLEDINIYTLGSNFSMVERIHAKRAQYNGTDWILEDGFVINYPHETHFPSSSNFTTNRGLSRKSRPTLKR